MKTVALMTIIMSIFGAGATGGNKGIESHYDPKPIQLVQKISNIRNTVRNSGIYKITTKLDLTSSQKAVLQSSLSIGKKIGVGKFLAAVTYQESSFGLFPVSYNHYGVGSVGYVAYQIVIKRHPWLEKYFKGHNWANVLIREPNISLWVSGYFIHYCYLKANDNWKKALNLYRYGYQEQGDYPLKVFNKLKEI